MANIIMCNLDGTVFNRGVRPENVVSAAARFLLGQDTDEVVHRPPGRHRFQGAWNR